MSGVSNAGNVWKPGEIKPVETASFKIGSNTTENKLEMFRENHCPEISKEQMNDYMDKGRDLEETLYFMDPQDSEGIQELGKQHGLEGIRNLMWRLTEKAASSDQLYISGAMRQPDEGGKVAAFLKAAGGNSVYGRISSHMKENVQKGQPQSGIDLKGLGLPAGKQTLLFAAQPDGTLYLKMEERGCPPFWKENFRSYKNFSEFAGHTADYGITRFKAKNTGIYAARKEHVPKELKKEYQKVMDFSSGVSTKQSFFQKVIAKFSKPEGARAEAFKDVKEGQKRGISEMERRLSAATDKAESKAANMAFDPKATDKEKQQAINAYLQASNLRDKLRTDYLEPARQAGYTGEIKGEEVLLPPLGS